MTEPRLGIVILAAGEARRFGACKQLALLHTKPLLQHVIDAALPLRPTRLVVMTGKYHEDIASAKDQGVVTGAELIHNPDWSSGMSSSIRLGCELLADDCDQLLVLLADQVLVSTSELETLTAQAVDGGSACAGFSETVGPPAVFSRACYPDLLTLNAENGAKKLLTDPAKQVTIVPMNSAGWEIDSKDDLERLSDVSRYIFGN
ncbi:MAG: nucleotidyltransferase family protein [Pseudomonadota bacterium]|nr:nucleotidyltransferase family protein [Pseudomonadota bacterium]